MSILRNAIVLALAIGAAAGAESATEVKVFDLTVTCHLKVETTISGKCRSPEFFADISSFPVPSWATSGGDAREKVLKILRDPSPVIELELLPGDFRFLEPYERQATEVREFGQRTLCQLASVVRPSFMAPSRVEEFKTTPMYRCHIFPRHDGHILLVDIYPNGDWFPLEGLPPTRFDPKTGRPDKIQLDRYSLWPRFGDEENEMAEGWLAFLIAKLGL